MRTGPPTSERSLPTGVVSWLPVTLIAPDRLPRKPKASGEADVKLLPVGVPVGRRVPSARCRLSALETWTEPCTFSVACGPKTHPDGLSRKRLAPGMVEATCPSLETSDRRLRD